MTTFQFTSPDGQKYSVTGPDGSTVAPWDNYAPQEDGPWTKYKSKSSQSDDDGPWTKYRSGDSGASPSMASGVGRAVATGVPIIGGLLNKADAATNAALAPILNPLFPEKDQLKGDFGQRYEQSMKTQQGMDEAFKAEHPIASIGGNIAGGVASLGAAAGTSLGAQALGLTAKTLPGMIGQGAVSGAARGGVDAAMRDENPVTGAIGGGLGGAAGPVIGAGVKAAIKPFMRATTAAVSPEIEAAQQITKAFEKDAGKGLSPDEINVARDWGQPVKGLEVGGGRATQRLARQAANFSPEAQELLDSTIYGRFRTQNTRTSEFLGEISNYPDAHEASKALTKSAREANRPAYAKAYAAGARGVWDDDLEQMIQAPVVQDALRKTIVSAKNEAAKMGVTPPKNPFTTDKDGRVVLGAGDGGSRAVPSLQFWDYVKRNLDAVGTRESREWSRVLRDHLDPIFPAYAEARAGAAKFFGAQDALQAGREAIGSKIDNRVLRDTLAKYTPDERKLFQDGFLDGIIHELRGRPDGRNIVDMINQSPRARERAAMALGPDKYAALEAYIRVEEHMDRFRKALGNSSTAQQLGDMASGSVMASLMGPRKMFEELFTHAAKAVGRGIDERVATKIAEMLTSGDGKEYAKAIRMISKNKSLMSAIRRPAEAAGGLAARGAASGIQAGHMDDKGNFRAYGE